MATTKVKNKRTGEIVEVNHPEGAGMEEIVSFANKQPAADEFADYDVTQDMSGADLFLAGIGKGMTDVVRGVGQATGLVSDDEVAEARARDEDLMGTGAGLGGNVVGGIAATLPAALIPGANTVAGAGLIGAGLGAVQPVVGDESRGQNALIGGGVGAAAVPLVGAISGVLAPQAKNVLSKVGLLNKEGVDTTVGQTLGGAAKTVEDKLTSVPVLGDMITKRRAEGYAQFNEAAINRALDPVGETLPKGLDPHQAVAHARKTLGGKYDALLGKMKGAVDPDFQAEVGELFQMVDTLPPEMQRYFKKIVEREVNRRITPAGTFSGQSLKDIESALGTEATSFANASGFESKLGDAVGALQESFRSMVARQNPDYARSLKNINKGYANFKIVQNAAGKVGADEGQFTPAQLQNAVRWADKSKDKRAFAEGDARMQDLSGAGKAILPSKIPDSGTAGRMFAGNPLLGVPGTLLGGIASPLYSKGAQGVGNAFTKGLLGYRPESLRAFGEGIGNVRQYATPFAVPAALGLMDEEIP